MIASFEGLPASVARDDAVLIAAWRAQTDEAAARRIVERLLPLVRGVALRCLPRPWMVDDAVQNTLGNVFRSLDSFDQRVPLSAWAVRLAKNACVDILRSWRRRLVSSFAELGSDEPDEHPRAMRTPSLDDVIGAREELRCVFRRVAAMDDTDRSIAALVLIEGISSREAAERIGLTAVAVRLRAFRIRAALRAAGPSSDQ